MRSVAVLGAGGVGGFVAAALERAGADVRVVARPATAAALRDTGFTVSSRALGEDFRTHPTVVTELSEAVDVLIVATKATGLMNAIERIRAIPALVVPLLNGLEHLAMLREHLGAERVVAAVIRIESDRPATGVIMQTSPTARIDMAAGGPALPRIDTAAGGPAPARIDTAAGGPALGGLAELLRGAGIDARVGDSEAQVMWSKLARLCALALTTSASDRPIGYVRSDPRWRSALEGAVNETVAVANAEGADLDAADTLAELNGAPAELRSSMQRDIAAGRATELDAIAGAVLRAGQRHGRRCPTVQWLAERVALRTAA